MFGVAQLAPLSLHRHLRRVVGGNALGQLDTFAAARGADPTRAHTASPEDR